MITQRVQALGNFEGSLIPAAPDSITQNVNVGDEIVITRSRLDVSTAPSTGGISDASIRSAALYIGYITKKPSPRSFQGYDLSMFLGTPAGRGDLLDTAINPTNTAWTLAQWVTALKPSSLSAGTVRVGGATWTGPPGGYRFMSRREALTDVCTKLSAEWRVTIDGALDADSVSVLYPTSTTPTCVVTSQQEGQHGTYRGLKGTLLQSGVDIEDYTTSAIVVGQGAGTSVITAVANSGATTYQDHFGNNLVMEQFVNSPSDDATTAAATATAELAKGSAIRRMVSVQSQTFGVTRYVKAGDYVYVYDQSAGLKDGANQIEFRGELVPVLKIRVFGLSWPIEKGMGVYCRHPIGPSYIDLSDVWEFETGDTTWDVGQVPMIYSSPVAPASSTGQSFQSAGAARLGVNPAIVNRVANTGPAWTSWTPTLGAQTGAFTTASAVAAYRRNERSIEYWVSITITTVGTAAGFVTFTLPTAAPAIAAASQGFLGAGRETTVTGKMLQVVNSVTYGVVLDYANASPIVAGAVLACAGVYESSL